MILHSIKTTWLCLVTMQGHRLLCEFMYLNIFSDKRISVESMDERNPDQIKYSSHVSTWLVQGRVSTWFRKLALLSSFTIVVPEGWSLIFDIDLKKTAVENSYMITYYKQIRSPTTASKDQWALYLKLNVDAT